VVAWTALAVVAALLARTRGSATGADHVMRGTFGAIVLPLLSYGVVGAALGGLGLAQSIRGTVSLGAEPRRAALASIGVAVAVSATAGGLLGLVVCGVAHGPLDPPLARDLPASLWIGALGGAAYAAYFSAASAIGKGWLRGVFLALDWILGASAGAGAALTPRGHVTSLLGGAQVAELSQRVSSAMLVAVVIVYVGVALGLTRRA